MIKPYEEHSQMFPPKKKDLKYFLKRKKNGCENLAFPTKRSPPKNHFKH